MPHANSNARHALASRIPGPWRSVLAEVTGGQAFSALADFVARERRGQTVFPPEGTVFRALELTPFDAVRAVILGQDPYHGPGQAHGLAFSVLPGVPHPPSLRNILRELVDDVGGALPPHGDLSHWASQGVLLLNAVLTVRQAQAHSHRRKGWEQVTGTIIRALADRAQPVVFILWGRPAQKLGRGVDRDRCPVIESPHPSPLSAHRGFFGSRPFSRANAALERLGQPPVSWAFPESSRPETPLPPR